MKTDTATKEIESLMGAGAHIAFGRGRRHPSVNDFIFGSKNKLDIFDLEKTNVKLEKALDFIKEIVNNKGSVLFVGGKSEASEIIRDAAESVAMPYVDGRWIGGTLTNFSEIRKRVDTMLSLMDQREKGELSKYTKKERLLIDRDIEKLKGMFWGVRDMKSLPKALFIVDPRFEHTALKEAETIGVKVAALCGSDNDIRKVAYPIPGNDSSRKSIKYFVDKVLEAIKK